MTGSQCLLEVELRSSSALKETPRIDREDRGAPSNATQDISISSGRFDGQVTGDEEWIARLKSSGSAHLEAVAKLHELMLRATRHQVHRMSEAASLGAVRCEEIAQASADEATVSALARLYTFEGRSSFSTWAYKFGILTAGVEMRRAIWQRRELRLRDVSEPTDLLANAPDSYAEGRDLADAVHQAMSEVLTDHQRKVAVALLVDGIPIDVLADRLESNRNAVYKTLHDARRRLRSHLSERGFTSDGHQEEVAR